MEELVGICSDGEPKNTGTENGVIRQFEKHLNRPLHWFVCLAHFNELPFRALYNKLESSVTKGPQTSTGVLAAKLIDCEKLKVFVWFLQFIFY